MKSKTSHKRNNEQKKNVRSTNTFLRHLFKIPVLWNGQIPSIMKNINDDSYSFKYRYCFLEQNHFLYISGRFGS